MSNQDNGSSYTITSISTCSIINYHPIPSEMNANVNLDYAQEKKVWIKHTEPEKNPTDNYITEEAPTRSFDLTEEE